MRGGLKVVAVRKCRFCGCTDDAPCRLVASDECAWMNDACDVCSNPQCVLAWAKAREQAERDRKAAVSAVVRPISERFFAERRRVRERRLNRSKRRGAERKAA